MSNVIQLADLENAFQDIATLAIFVNSTDLTVTNRDGRTFPTLFALVNQIESSFSGYVPNLIDTVTGSTYKIVLTSGVLTYAVAPAGSTGVSGFNLLDTITGIAYTVYFANGVLDYASLPSGSAGAASLKILDSITGSIQTLSIQNGQLTY
jgi:hypothetical protein